MRVQGPTSAGVTWDFSSPSPSAYKKFSQRSYAKREEETNRIAEQVVPGFRLSIDDLTRARGQQSLDENKFMVFTYYREFIEPV